MAANNYYGFTHGGTQYGAQTAYAAAAPAAGYAAAQYARTATGAYDYTTGAAAPAPAATPSYATYTPKPAAPAATYDTSTYGFVRPGAGYDSTKYNQYNTGDYGYGTAAAKTTAAPAVSANYGYSAGTTGYTPNTTTSSYSGYDAALYSAATTYLQQGGVGTGGGAKTNWSQYKGKTGMGAAGQKARPKQPPKPQQLHYCDVCKISCAGPQTYREHLEGQKHKKKEAAAKSGIPPEGNRKGRGGMGGARGATLRCELCDVTCTGADAYAAHIRGAKHLKVVKLHQKLGKPIPSSEPTVVNPGPGGATTTTAVMKNETKVVNKVQAGGQVKKVIGVPKINFVGGTQLRTSATAAAQAVSGIDDGMDMLENVDDYEDEPADTLDALKQMEDVQPVGADYIEEMKSDDGSKVVSFHCKLCDCRFNDPNAKEMHMKGRRHRLQYKKKVDPELIVDIKPTNRNKNIRSGRPVRGGRIGGRDGGQIGGSMDGPMFGRGPPSGIRGNYFPVPSLFGAPTPLLPPSAFHASSRPNSFDDRHVIHKHGEIYPKEEQLQAIQKIVTNVEKALKLVSDSIAEEDGTKKELKEEPKTNGDTDAAADGKDEPKLPERLLKGVMRVGILAKGLILSADNSVNLVVLCSEKPTLRLLDRIYTLFPEQLAIVTEEKYNIAKFAAEAAIIVSTLDNNDFQVTVKITFTSPLVRDITAEPAAAGEGAGATTATVIQKDPPDLLDKQKCLDALAALRHAKWFQARVTGLQSAVMIIRIVRDMVQRLPSWAPLNIWACELLVEKVLGSSPAPLTPGEALRRIFECVASGIILPGGPGLIDPCEKDPINGLGEMTTQQAEDITASAQHALRLMAYRQVYKVLGIELIKYVPRAGRTPFTRKRRREDGEVMETEEADGKKVKDEAAAGAVVTANGSSE